MIPLIQTFPLSFPSPSLYWIVQWGLDWTRRGWYAIKMVQADGGGAEKAPLGS